MSAQDNTNLENVKSNNEKNSGLAFKRSSRARKPFTIVDRSFMQINGKDLSDISFRIICYLMSLPEDWKVQMSQLRNHLDVGHEKLKHAMRELADKGYVRRSKEKRDDGTFCGWDTEYSDVPEFLKANKETTDSLVFRPSEKPDVGEIDPYITHNDQNILNTTTTNPEPESKHDKVVVDFDKDLISELQSYGVYPESAKLFVQEHPESYLRSKIAFVNEYKKQGKKIDDMGSLLYQAIIKNWAAPKNEGSPSGTENIDQYMSRKQSEAVREEMEKEVKRGALVEKLGIQMLSRKEQDEEIEQYRDRIAKNTLDSMKGKLRLGEAFDVLCGANEQLAGAMS